MYRTHTCAELTKKESRKEVTLSGWVHRRRNHGGLIFIDLRDMYGVTQVTFNPDINKNAWQIADSLRSEFVIKVSGKVSSRPKDMINENLVTGEIEVMAEDVEILSKCSALPFEIDSEIEANEDLRLKYRFLDLRRERMKQNLIYRGQVIKFIRDWCYKHKYLERHHFYQYQFLFQED